MKNHVLTFPEFRRKGIATKVITFLIDEARKSGVSTIDLSATKDGKHLYEIPKPTLNIFNRYMVVTVGLSPSNNARYGANVPM